LCKAKRERKLIPNSPRASSDAIDLRMNLILGAGGIAE